MNEEEKRDQQEKDRPEKDRPEKEPETETGKDATPERVAEEESGGALPSTHSDES